MNKIIEGDGVEFEDSNTEADLLEEERSETEGVLPRDGPPCNDKHYEHMLDCVLPCFKTVYFDTDFVSPISSSITKDILRKQLSLEQKNNYIQLRVNGVTNELAKHMLIAEHGPLVKDTDLFSLIGIDSKDHALVNSKALSEWSTSFRELETIDGTYVPLVENPYLAPLLNQNNREFIIGAIRNNMVRSSGIVDLKGISSNNEKRTTRLYLPLSFAAVMEYAKQEGCMGVAARIYADYKGMKTQGTSMNRKPKVQTFSGTRTIEDLLDEV